MSAVSDREITRVLYVEDDPDIRAIAEIALQEIGGFEAALCESGAVAVETAPSFEPELILLDVMMPGMDGPSTLKALRELDGMAEIPVIFMTARLQNSEIREYRELGALGVIPKPFDPMTLSDQISRILRDARD
ncbi:response regulator [Marinobacter sp. BW6]|uniref:response regulator n=1 Tax=Marinobacter sp. BW6 TaxID=2592624 RepID=UPI0011DE7A43|nr:response regulator [Marinobacter sp. BW6]TYC57051.1 response regulator [Marinobacter sp. BW6]